jgi:hypothetical protein
MVTSHMLLFWTTWSFAVDCDFQGLTDLTQEVMVGGGRMDGAKLAWWHWIFKTRGKRAVINAAHACRSRAHACRCMNCQFQPTNRLTSYVSLKEHGRVTWFPSHEHVRSGIRSFFARIHVLAIFWSAEGCSYTA